MSVHTCEVTTRYLKARASEGDVAMSLWCALGQV